MSTIDDGNRPTDRAKAQAWNSLVDELRTTSDVSRTKELILLLEKAIFDRQQELALNAENVEQHTIDREEQRLKEVLDLMLEVKAKRLGFPGAYDKDFQRKGHEEKRIRAWRQGGVLEADAICFNR